jgi:hypothetical protein
MHPVSLALEVNSIVTGQIPELRDHWCLDYTDESFLPLRLSKSAPSKSSFERHSTTDSAAAQ